MRPAETFTVVADDVESRTLPGFATTDTSWSPCFPLGVPPVEAPASRVRRSPNERALTRSGFEMNWDGGTTTPVTPWAFISCVAGST